MTNNINAYDNLNTIRPSSSSLTRAPSWSLGVGANSEDLYNYDRNNPNRETGNSNPSNQLNSTSSEYTSVYPKLTIQIPTVYLTKKDTSSSSTSTTTSSSSSSSSYHVYQLTITTSTGEEWSVYRRYSQFYELHQQLKTRDPNVVNFNFPPKKRLNSKASTIVQDRRRKLEEYVNTLNCYIEKLPPNLYNSGSLQQLHDIISCNSMADNRVRSLCETNSLSDSANSEPTCSANNQVEHQVQRINGLLPSSSRSTNSSDPTTTTTEQYGVANKESVRSLFHKFISLQDRKDEHFDPVNLGG